MYNIIFLVKINGTKIKITRSFSSIGKETAELLRIQRMCGGWILSKYLVTFDQLVRVSPVGLGQR